MSTLQGTSTEPGQDDKPHIHREKPTEARASMKSKYGMERDYAIPEESLCADATTTSRDPDAPLAILKQKSHEAILTSIAPDPSTAVDFASPSASSPKAWREDAFTSACPGGQGGPNDYPRERQLDLVVHDFNGPQLHTCSAHSIASALRRRTPRSERAQH